MNLRNKPCQCGSGKKYKNCCGNNAEKARLHQQAWAAPKPTLADKVSANLRKETNIRRDLKERMPLSNRTGMSRMALLAAIPAALLGGMGSGKGGRH